MSFDMLPVLKDRLIVVEALLKRMRTSQRKQIIHKLKIERANLNIEIDTIEAKRAKKEQNLK